MHKKNKDWITPCQLLQATQMRPQKDCGWNVLGGTVGGEEDSLRDASKFMSRANQKKRKDFPYATLW